VDGTFKEQESAFGQPNCWLLANASAHQFLSQYLIRRYWLILRQKYTGHPEQGIKQALGLIIMLAINS